MQKKLKFLIVVTALYNVFLVQAANNDYSLQEDCKLQVLFEEEWAVICMDTGVKKFNAEQYISGLYSLSSQEKTDVVSVQSSVKVLDINSLKLLGKRLVGRCSQDEEYNSFCNDLSPVVDFELERKLVREYMSNIHSVPLVGECIFNLYMLGNQKSTETAIKESLEDLSEGSLRFLKEELLQQYNQDEKYSSFCDTLSSMINFEIERRMVREYIFNLYSLSSQGLTIVTIEKSLCVLNMCSLELLKKELLRKYSQAEKYNFFCSTLIPVIDFEIERRMVRKYISNWYLLSRKGITKFTIEESLKNLNISFLEMLKQEVVMQWSQGEDEKCNFFYNRLISMVNCEIAKKAA